jgi:hypothetical protein
MNRRFNYLFVLAVVLFAGCASNSKPQRASASGGSAPSNAAKTSDADKTREVKGVLLEEGPNATSQPVSNQVVYLLRVKSSGGNQEVEFTSEEIQGRGQTSTDAKGEFHFKNVLPGTYSVLLGATVGGTYEFEPLRTSQGLLIQIVVKETDPTLDLGTIRVKEK